QIETPMQSYHMHNEHRMIEGLVKSMAAGTVMALISDAGTPAISDPGFLIVRACIQNNIPVECLPGATAFVPALVDSGLPNDRFAFEGFLPPKKGRQTRLQMLTEESKTMIFYEAPHKLVKTLQDLAKVLGGDRQASVSREISKLFETHQRGSLDALRIHFEQHPPKGEIVIVVAGKNS
ncbi:MAG: rRNA small subunit methyltransferase 1, partial [Flavobacteriaceae bacterium]|nr:rRNA small subunit methyltransferase 1 [Flavobacteriaceae bacterium]